MSLFTVNCWNYEICGSQETFNSSDEALFLGEDYMCAECYAAEEMAFYEVIGWDDSDALASAGFGMDEDY